MNKHERGGGEAVVEYLDSNLRLDQAGRLRALRRHRPGDPARPAQVLERRAPGGLCVAGGGAEAARRHPEGRAERRRRSSARHAAGSVDLEPHRQRRDLGLRRRSAPRSFSVVDQDEPAPPRRVAQVAELRRRERVMVRKGPCLLHARRRAAAACRRTSPAARCPRRRGPAGRASCAAAPGSGTRRPRRTGLPCGRRVGRAPARPARPRRSPGRRRPGAIAPRSGARRGPAGSTRPLPRPAAPSTTASARSFASEGFCSPSSITITLAPPSAARRAPAARSRDTIGRRRAGEEQGLVADIRGAGARPRPAAGPAGARHSRGSGRRGSRPPAAAGAAAASAVGVLPAPPTVRLPTQITGTGARAPERPMRRPATAP